jgi:hypothetical protein
MRKNKDIKMDMGVINLRLTYSDCVNELIIADMTITVLIERVVNASQLLSSHEYSELRAHLLEFKLV